jgi:signal transduction histidine kinase/ligand-binding sensor domain-containing protein
MQISRTKSIELLGAILILCFACACVFGERLPIRVYTTADGLGSSFVDGVFRDSRGFMWFSTRDGLSRFDGSRFITYQIAEKNSPPGIEAVFESSRGEYWITTTGGTYRFKPNAASEDSPLENKTDVRPNLNAEFISERRGGFYEDDARELWYFTDKIYRVGEKETKVTFEEFDFDLPEKYRDQPILNVSKDADGSFWVLTKLGIFRRLPDSRIVYYDGQIPTSGSSFSFVKDDAGNIWLTRPNGLFIINPEPLEALKNLPPFTVRNLAADAIVREAPRGNVRLPEKFGEIINYKNFDETAAVLPKYLYKSSDGHVWMTTTQTLVEFDGKTFNVHSSTQGFTQEPGRMAEDLNGNLWIGGQSGAVRLDRHGLTTFNINDAPGQGRVRSIYQNYAGEIFAFIGQGFVSRFDGRDFRTTRLQIPAGNQFLWTSTGGFLDRRGEWWVTINPKLYRFAAQPNFAALAREKPSGVYDSSDGLPSDRLYCMFEDSRGNLYVSTRGEGATQDSGLAIWLPEENKFRRFTEADGFPPNKSPGSFAEDSAGNLWFGFYEGGAARYKDGRFTDFSREVNLPTGLISDIYSDRSGKLWLASSNGGLVRSDDSTADQPQFVHLTTENGLSSNNIRSITEDNFGRIYLGTVRGVDRLTPETGIVKRYSVNDGLATDFVDTAFRDANGVLWFGTPNGISRLVPEKEEMSSVPPILIAALRVAGVEKKLSELGERKISNLELAASENNLQIDFFGIDFKPSETLRYQYRLEGADADWSTPTEQRAVNYANLSAGEYRFVVRAVNADGIHSPQFASISFNILPPIWARWWFVALCFLFAVGVFIVVERYRAARLRELRETNDELTNSEARFRRLVEQSPVGIMILEADGTIRSANRAYMDVWGKNITFEQIKNWDLFSDKQLAAQGVSEGLQSAFAGEPYVFNPLRYELRRNDAGVEIPDDAPEFVYMQAIAYPVKNETGELREVICFLEDITEKHTARTALENSRLERLAELERVRSRIATDLHDDIGASLTQIAVLSEVAQTTAKAGNGAFTQPLQLISNVSNELVETMSDIVWAINPSKDHLSDLTQRMRRFASDVLSAKAIRLHFDTSESEGKTIVNTNLRREVFLIFKESINNVVKHSGAKHARVELKITDARLTLEIADDGNGFTPESRAADDFSTAGETGGNGLLSIKRRALEMNGELTIKSENSKGTIITLNLPLDATIQTGGEAKLKIS